MRRCIRCNQQMIEDLQISSEIHPAGLRVTESGIFKDSLGKIMGAACPGCGYVEMYLDRVDRLSRLKK